MNPWFRLPIPAIALFIFALSASAQTGGVYVATYVDVRLNSTSQGESLIKQYREATRKENGNSSIDVVQEIGRPNHFVIVEVWKDQPSFDAHERSGHVVGFRDMLKAIHSSPYDQRVHSGLAADSRPRAIGGSGICVVSHVDVPPQSRADTEVLLKRHAEESRKDEGNRSYEALQQTAPRTNHFTLFEVWQDRKSFDAHEMTAHTRQFREGLGPMLGAPYDQRLFTPLK